MKIKNVLIGVLIIISLMTTACKKYPDGPSISLKSRTARVSNVWKMSKVILDGSDITSDYTSVNYTETYDKSGNYSYNSSLGSGSGKWVFENKDMEIKRSGVSGQTSNNLTILCLKENLFWYKFADGKGTYEFHLITN